MQPTCPFRDPKKIILSLKKIKSGLYDSAVSVVEVKTDHPLRMKVFKSKYLKNFIKKKKENTKPRQTLNKIFIRSGSIYLFNRDVLMKRNSVVGKKCYGLILRDKEATNIDTQDQLNYLKFKYEKSNKLKLLCPSPDSFSKIIKKRLSKKFNCKFLKMSNSKFNKVCHKYEIILIRMDNNLKYG